MKKYNQLTSVNLIEKLKEFEKTPPKITGFSISRMKYLISLILTHKQKNFTGSWSVLNMTYMKNVVPRADQYLKFLRNEQIIQWKEYSAGRNSRMYRLIDEKKTRLEEITDNSIIQRIEINRGAILMRNSKMYPVLNQYIRETSINVDGALKTIESEYSNNVLNDNKKAESRRTYSLAQVLKFESGCKYYSVNPTNGRLDSNITGLPNELVKHLVIDNKTLIEIDIKNSQLFFAAALTDPTPEIEQLMLKYLGKSLTMYTKSLHISECKDVKLYQFLVTHGIFYEHMTNKFTGNKLLKSRDQVKEAMFIVLFGKIHAHIYSKEARIFRNEFPNIQKLLDAIKKNNHNKLAIFLQRVESYCILERVSLEIINQYPNIKFVTKHDSILPCTILMKEYDFLAVKGMIMAIIEEITGFLPQIKVKSHKKNNSKMFRAKYPLNQIKPYL
jgi:hypothetical protein